MSDDEFVFQNRKNEEKSGKHRDAQKNKAYFDACWNSKEVQDRVSAFRKTCDECAPGTPDASVYFSKRYMGIDPYVVWEKDKQETCYRELTGVQVMWCRQKIKSGFSLSFHQSSEEFKEECKKILAVKDNPMQTSYKSWVND